MPKVKTKKSDKAPVKVEKYDNEQEWLEARRGRITGTRLGSLFSKRDKKPLKGYYELIAERVAIPRDGENVLDRGKRLEEEALERFELETGKRVDKSLVIVSRDDNDDIAYSPDGFIMDGGKIVETQEVKCLNSAAHLQAWLTKKIPSEYEEQYLQSFIVNDDQKLLDFIFYDPSMPKDFFFFEVRREDVQEQIDEWLETERRVLAEIAEIEKQLTF